MSLLRLFGANELVHAEFKNLRAHYVARMNEIFSFRDRARREGNDIHTFGDGELLLQYSLDFLSDLPTDISRNATLFKGIVNAFFATGFVVSTSNFQRYVNHVSPAQFQ